MRCITMDEELLEYLMHEGLIDEQEYKNYLRLLTEKENNK